VFSVYFNRICSEIIHDVTKLRFSVNVELFEKNHKVNYVTTKFKGRVMLNSFGVCLHPGNLQRKWIKKKKEREIDQWSKHANRGSYRYKMNRNWSLKCSLLLWNSYRRVALCCVIASIITWWALSSELQSGFHNLGRSLSAEVFRIYYNLWTWNLSCELFVFRNF
jgi:hypothetical protein